MSANSRRVVCAAIRASDGDVLTGIRHYSPDMRRQIKMRYDGEKFMRRRGDDQGFVDQHGTYMTRQEAYQVAQDAGQPIDESACASIGGKLCLYSEAVY